jgi:hypothetical protein
MDRDCTTAVKIASLCLCAFCKWGFLIAVRVMLFSSFNATVKGNDEVIFYLIDPESVH